MELFSRFFPRWRRSLGRHRRGCEVPGLLAGGGIRPRWLDPGASARSIDHGDACPSATSSHYGRGWKGLIFCLVQPKSMECIGPLCHISQARALNALFFPCDVGERNDPLVSRLANGCRLVISRGGGQRYLLCPDNAGYRLRQLTGLVPLGGKRPEMTAGWVAARSAAVEWLRHPPPAA